MLREPNLEVEVRLLRIWVRQHTPRELQRGLRRGELLTQPPILVRTLTLVVEAKADEGEAKKEAAKRKDITGASTAVREAYFLAFAKDIRKALNGSGTRLMVTGGFRSAAVMRASLQGECDMVGVGRPLCGAPHCVRELLAGKIDRLPSYENTLQLPWLMQGAMGLKQGRLALVGAMQQWYYRQLILMGDRGKPDPGLSPLGQMMWMEVFEETTAYNLTGKERWGDMEVHLCRHRDKRSHALVDRMLYIGGWFIHAGFWFQVLLALAILNGIYSYSFRQTTPSQ